MRTDRHASVSKALYISSQTQKASGRLQQLVSRSQSALLLSTTASNRISTTTTQ